MRKYCCITGETWEGLGFGNTMNLADESARVYQRCEQSRALEAKVEIDPIASTLLLCSEPVLFDRFALRLRPRNA